MATSAAARVEGAGGAPPARAGPAERLRFLLGWAVLAPSRHNAQPWLFEIEGDELRVYADRGRTLPAADPDGRQLVMGCGAAIANLRLAAAHYGHATSLEEMPGHRSDGLLARVRLEEKSASTPEAEAMFQAIPRRRTHRLPLDGRDPPDGLVTALLREARREGAWLRPVEVHQRRVVAEIVAAGEDAQWASARFRRELAEWTRTSKSARRDGMPGFALGMSDAAVLARPLLARVQNPARAEADRARRRVLASKALLVLSTPQDGPAEWFRAGEALQRMLLRATAAGLFASFFSQPIAMPDLRRRLAEAIGDPGAPQIMFRFGYGLEPRPSPRRPVDEVLRRVDPGRRRPEALVVRTPPPRPAIRPTGANATVAGRPAAEPRSAPPGH